MIAPTMAIPEIAFEPLINGVCNVGDFCYDFNSDKYCQNEYSKNVYVHIYFFLSNESLVGKWVISP